MSAKILIVDDEDLIRWSLSQDLGAAGYRTVAVPDLASALRALEEEPPDVVLTDLRLGGDSGIEVLKAARAAQPGLPVVLMTGFADFASAVEALREGAADYITKPLQLPALKITLKRVLETSALRSRLSQAEQKRRERYSFESIICASPAMKEIVATARKIAASPVGTVLLLGESGCGKDRLARAIHFESPRSAQPLMEISCTAIPEQLLESELFGHERGSFTSADKQRRGLFELADGGTVFLNEIGHMPASLQAKILRVLEDKTFKRVGGRDDITVDVRIVAATNEDLERAVAENRFRADLYYRINVLTLRLKPLRERPEDVLPLIEALTERLARDLNRPKPRLPEETLAALRGYAWPGNVRELRNALERMLILGETRFAPPERGPWTGAAPQAAAKPEGFPLPEEGVRIEDVERALVQQALAKTRGNQQRAAQLLGLSRDALRRRIEKFGLAAAGVLAALALASAPSRAGWFAASKAEAADPFAAAFPDKVKELKDKKGAHAPAREGACAKCHADPKDPAKLVMEAKALCLSCHAERSADLAKASVHAAFRDADCTACHQPHASEQPHLLNAPVNELCGTCHDARDASLAKAHFGITSFEGACTDCHTPHGSSNAKLIKEGRQHVPFGSRSCEMCHKPTEKDGKPALKDMPGESCFVCHSDFRRLGEQADVHPPFGAGQCTSCHNPHVGARPSLMRGPTADVCLGCHDAASLKDAHPVARHPTSKEGREDPRRKGKPFDCASCHDPHANAGPKLTRFDVMNKCGECHEK